MGAYSAPISYFPFPISPVRSRRKTPQRATHIAFTQPLQRTIAQLADAFACDAEHRADLFERVLATALETKVEAQHLRIPRRERAERLLDLVGEEAVHRFF